jgi:hypothetical protein
MRLATLLAALFALLPRAAGWSTAAPLPERLQAHHGVLDRGRIYVAGGFDTTNVPTRVAYRFDPRAARRGGAS